MRRTVLHICFLLALMPVAAQTRLAQKGSVIEVDGSFLRQITPRDSILIADQILYGITLNDLDEGTLLGFPDLRDASNDTLTIVRGWKIDTLKTSRNRSTGLGRYDIEAGIVIAAFEAGEYQLPPLAVQRVLPGGQIDTLVFESREMEVKTMPVDTASFVVHDIKGQIRYPLTLQEILPYVIGFYALFLIIVAVWCLIVIHRKKVVEQNRVREPAHIVALRKLDAFRGNALWAPEKQKAFYSGVTDTLREYMEARYEIDALNMTTAEIFTDLKQKNITPELLEEVEDLFVRADFVKFAKYSADDTANASALPVAVRFVTSTYQVQVEEEVKDVL